MTGRGDRRRFIIKLQLLSKAGWFLPRGSFSASCASTCEFETDFGVSDAHAMQAFATVIEPIVSELLTAV